METGKRRRPDDESDSTEHIKELTPVEKEAKRRKINREMITSWFDGDFDFEYGGTLYKDDHRPEREQFTKDFLSEYYLTQAVWVLGNFCSVSSDSRMACQTCGGENLWKISKTGKDARAAFCVMLSKLREDVASINLDKNSRADLVKQTILPFKPHIDGLNDTGVERFMSLVGKAPLDGNCIEPTKSETKDKESERSYPTHIEK